MLKNQEATSTTGTPPIDTSHELKWRRTLRKKLINCLVLIENHGKHDQDAAIEYVNRLKREKRYVRDVY